MKNDNLEQLKEEYLNIPIPKELDSVVKKALIEGRKNIDKKNSFKKIRALAASIAAAVVLITIGVNSSPVFAKALSGVPIVGSIIKVLTFKEYTIDEDNFDANIKVPVIQGIENKDLESSLNKKYLDENKRLYEQFTVDMKDLKENIGGHLGIGSGYIVKTDTDKIFSIGRYVVNTVGSSSTTFKYDTIDKEKEILITLPSIFKDDSYVDVISENIKEQMREQYNSDNNRFYWVEGIEQTGSVELFEKISKEQSFYINVDSKLVISFNKYDVAPGYMGVVEFVIPTEAIANILAGSEYIK